MKHLSRRLRPDSLGKYMRSHPIFPFLPENALFWTFLLLLSIGSMCTLYQKAAGREPSAAANTQPEAAAYYDEYPLPSGSVLRVYNP